MLISAALLAAAAAFIQPQCAPAARAASLPAVGVQLKVGSNLMKRLASPEDYIALLRAHRLPSASDDILIVKWSYDEMCRTCRAATPKIRSLLKRFQSSQPSAQFYAMDIQRGQETMIDFFKARNVTRMPFVEVYVGGELIESMVVPPSRVSFLRTALQQAADRLKSARRHRTRRRLLLQARQAPVASPARRKLARRRHLLSLSLLGRGRGG